MLHLCLTHDPFRLIVMPFAKEREANLRYHGTFNCLSGTFLNRSPFWNTSGTFYFTTKMLLLHVTDATAIMITYSVCIEIFLTGPQISTVTRRDWPGVQCCPQCIPLSFYCKWLQEACRSSLFSSKIWKRSGLWWPQSCKVWKQLIYLSSCGLLKTRRCVCFSLFTVRNHSHYQGETP